MVAVFDVKREIISKYISCKQNLQELLSWQQSSHQPTREGKLH